MSIQKDWQENIQDTKAIAVQHNSLINARYEFSLLEIRVFTDLLGKIKPNDKEFGRYHINFTELMNKAGVSTKSIHHDGMEAVMWLMKKIIKVPLADQDKILATPLLSAIKYKEGDGWVEVTFQEELKPFLLQLKEQFTLYEIQNIFKLKSIYSARLYPMMKQYEKIGYREIEVEKIKRVLGVEDKYDEFFNMENKILKVAKKEISEKTDISIDYKKKKRGRGVHTIRFTIEPKIMEEPPALSPIEQRLKEYFLLTTKQIERVLGKYKDMEELGKILNDIETRYRDKKIKAIASYTYRVLMDTQKTQRSLFDVEIEKQQVVKLQARIQEQEEKQRTEAERMQKEIQMKKQINDVLAWRSPDRLQQELTAFAESKYNNLSGRKLFTPGKEMSRSAEIYRNNYIFATYIKPKEETPTA